jgi:succinoglycan biosynthesis transport protein ExoP
MDVRQAARTVRQRWWIVVLGVVVVAVAAGGWTLASPRVYTTSAQALVSISSPQSKPAYMLASGSQYILDRMTSYAQLGETPRVLGPVASSLRLDESATALQAQVTSLNRVDTASIDVTAEYGDPETAARIADAVARRLGDTIQELENNTVKVSIAGHAPIPSAPSNHKLARTAVLGGAGGLVLGLAIALLIPARPERRTAVGH